jgi:hypothetical protein
MDGLEPKYVPVLATAVSCIISVISIAFIGYVFLPYMAGEPLFGR